MKEVTKYFFTNTNFDRIFAVGKIAEKYLKDLGFKPIYIRHPSFGGINKFTSSINNNFKIKSEKMNALVKYF